MTLYQVCYLAVKLIIISDGTVTSESLVQRNQCDVYEAATPVAHDGENGTLNDDWLTSVTDDLTARYSCEEVPLRSVSRWVGNRWVFDTNAF